MIHQAVPRYLRYLSPIHRLILQREDPELEVAVLEPNVVFDRVVWTHGWKVSMRSRRWDRPRPRPGVVGWEAAFHHLQYSDY